VKVLGVSNVVVCGHSRCGAMSALREGIDGLEDLGALTEWSRGIVPVAGDLKQGATLDVATQACSVRQLRHLRSYPVVADAIARGELNVHAWFYDVDGAEVLEWDSELDSFVPVGTRDDERDATRERDGGDRVPVAAS